MISWRCIPITFVLFRLILNLVSYFGFHSNEKLLKKMLRWIFYCALLYILTLVILTSLLYICVDILGPLVYRVSIFHVSNLVSFPLPKNRY